jgi:hypothetical protein
MQPERERERGHEGRERREEERKGSDGKGGEEKRWERRRDPEDCQYSGAPVGGMTRTGMGQ